MKNGKGITRDPERFPIEEGDLDRTSRERNLLFSLISTVLCCPICGMVALYYALTSSDAYEYNDITEFKRRSKRSMIWAAGSVICGICTMVVLGGCLLFLLLVVLPDFKEFAMPIKIKGPLEVDIVGEIMLSNRGKKLAEYRYATVAARNRNDVIKLGNADNFLIEHVLHEKFQKIMEKGAPLYTHFDCPTFTKTLAGFFNDYFKPHKQVESKNVWLYCGADTVIEQISSLLADEGDHFLVPSPFYYDLFNNWQCVQQVHPYPVQYNFSKHGNHFTRDPMTKEKLEKSLADARENGINIKGLFVVNPDNPSGAILTDQEMEVYINFANEHNIHLVMDEVYLLSSYGETKARSILSFPTERPDLIHVIWSFAKDFAIPAFRVGTLITQNKELQKALHWSCMFHIPSSLTQHVLEELIKDRKWLDVVYFPANLAYLREGLSRVRQILDRMEILYCIPEGGMYIWINLGKWLTEKTFDEEFKLWQEFLKGGVYLNYGRGCGMDDPGWFRIVFALRKDDFNIGMQRFEEIISNKKC